MVQKHWFIIYKLLEKYWNTEKCDQVCIFTIEQITKTQRGEKVYGRLQRNEITKQNQF